MGSIGEPDGRSGNRERHPGPCGTYGTLESDSEPGDGSASDGGVPGVSAGFADEPFFRGFREFLRVLGDGATVPDGVQEAQFLRVRESGLDRSCSVSFRATGCTGFGESGEDREHDDESRFHIHIATWDNIRSAADPAEFRRKSEMKSAADPAASLLSRTFCLIHVA